MSQVIIYRSQVIAAMDYFEPYGSNQEMTTLAVILGLMEHKARDNLAVEVDAPACQLMRSIGQELAVLSVKYAETTKDALQSSIALRTSVLNPSVVPAHKRKYRIIKISDTRTGVPTVFSVSRPCEVEIGPASTFEKAWAMAMRDYLESCGPLERGGELDIGQALDDDRIYKLPNEDGFFVLKTVEVFGDSKLHDLTGWRIDASGLKDRAVRGPVDGSPVRLSTAGLRVIAPDEVELLRQLFDEITKGVKIDDTN